MAEPLGSTTTVPEAAMPIVDSGLQEAAQGLADQLDGIQPGESAPLEASPEPEVEPAPAPVAESARPAFRFNEQHQKFMSGARGRVQRERARLRELEAIQGRYEESQRQTAEVLKSALEAMRARGGPQQAEEEIPDPALDMPGFLKWARSQNETALKPVMEAIERQEQRFQALEQSREQQAEQERQQSAIVRQFEGWEREYQQESPELAVGVRERYAFGRDLLASALRSAGVEGQEAQEFAVRHLYAIAKAADAAGDNGVAALDGFVVGLYGAVWEMVRQDLAEDGLQIPAFGERAPAQASPAPAPAAAATPQPPSEIERLKAVQQRTAAAGDAAPRAPARPVEGGSELQTLWRAGVRDHHQLLAAALKEAKGNMMKAQTMLGELIDAM